MAKKTTIRKRKSVNMEAMLIKMHYIDKLQTIYFSFEEKGLKPVGPILQKMKDYEELIKVLDAIT